MDNHIPFEHRVALNRLLKSQSAPAVRLVRGHTATHPYAEDRGFTTVGILDAGFPVALPSLDVTIKLARTRDNAMHLFAVKTLMLFEEALATFSAQRAADDNARHSETLAVHHAPSSLVNPAHSEEARSRAPSRNGRRTSQTSLLPGRSPWWSTQSPDTTCCARLTTHAKRGTTRRA